MLLTSESFPCAKFLYFSLPIPKYDKYRVARNFAVLIFAIFPAIRQNKFSQMKITANIFSRKIYSRVNIL